MASIRLTGLTLPNLGRQQDIQMNAGEIAIFHGDSLQTRYALLQCLSGHGSPPSGSVLIDDEDISGMAPEALAKAQSKVSYVYGNDLLLDYLTIVENCLVPEQDVTGITIERTKMLFRNFGVKNAERRYPKDLTLEERRLCAFLRAFRRDPDIILAFEPLNGLTPEAQAWLFEAMASAAESKNILLIITSPDEIQYSPNQNCIRINLGQGLATPPDEEVLESC